MPRMYISKKMVNYLLFVHYHNKKPHTHIYNLPNVFLNSLSLKVMSIITESRMKYLSWFY